MVQVGGDSAKSECYGLTVGTSENEQDEPVDTMFGGRYLNEFQKREGQWRISKRTDMADWAHRFPNGLDALASSGLMLNILQIQRPVHESYGRL
jgi:hypothetical protein